MKSAGVACAGWATHRMKVACEVADCGSVVLVLVLSRRLAESMSTFLFPCCRSTCALVEVSDCIWRGCAAKRHVPVGALCSVHPEGSGGAGAGGRMGMSDMAENQQARERLLCSSLCGCSRNAVRRALWVGAWQREPPTRVSLGPGLDGASTPAHQATSTHTTDTSAPPSPNPNSTGTPRRTL